MGIHFGTRDQATIRGKMMASRSMLDLEIEKLEDDARMAREAGDTTAANVAEKQLKDLLAALTPLVVENPASLINAVLHIRNPIRMQDMGALWDSFQVLNDISAFPTDPDEQYGMDIDVSRQMAPAMLTDIIFTPAESAVIRKKMTAAQDKGVPFKQGKSGKIIINKNYKPASLTRQEILQEAIKAKGYDGIVYRNQYEVTADYDG